MTQDHPITPQKWQVDTWCKQAGAYGADVDSLFVQAYQAGADEELEACCEWLRSSLPGYDKHYADYLRAARRPKPPSLKEQSLALIDKIQSNKEMWQTDDLDVVRRALESLPD